MKKNYSYSIDVDFTGNTGNSIINEIIAEVESDENQLKLTEAINKATVKLHKEIFVDFITEVNDAILPIGVEFCTLTLFGASWFAMCKINNGWSHILMLDALPEHGFKDSKYVTYTGKYALRIGRSPNHHYTVRQREELKGRVECVDDVLKYMRDDLKIHVAKSRKMRGE